jgi:hypothetical protein
MATQLQQQADTLISDTLEDFVLIRTADIEAGDRLRDIDPVWAKALGQVMAREGQRTPIEVCRLPGRTHWTLVSGAHRLFGAQDSGIPLLRAEIVSADRNDRRMREISENLWRRDLDPIDRAAFIAELVNLRRLQAGLTEAGRREASVHTALRRQVDAEAEDTLETISNVYGFTEEVGEQLGFTGRTIRNDLLLYRGLAPSLVERLRAERHPVARNASQLRALAKLDRDRQALAVDRLTRNGCKNVAEALLQMPGGKPPADAETKRLSAFLGAFQRMSLAEKKGALAHLSGLLPAGATISDKAQVDQAHEALTAAFDFFVGCDAWDTNAPLGMIMDEARDARGKVQLALMTANGRREV